jgi:tRNA U34 2-thiouridine synthase MnmA/TrmU
VNYNDFIRRYVGEKEGKIIELETGKILGKHKGLLVSYNWSAKRTGIIARTMVCCKKDTDENIVYVSNGYDPRYTI